MLRKNKKERCSKSLISSAAGRWIDDKRAAGIFSPSSEREAAGEKCREKKKPNRRKEDRGEEGDNGVGGMI